MLSVSHPISQFYSYPVYHILLKSDSKLLGAQSCLSTFLYLESFKGPSASHPNWLICRSCGTTLWQLEEQLQLLYPWARNQLSTYSSSMFSTPMDYITGIGPVTWHLGSRSRSACVHHFQKTILTGLWICFNLHHHTHAYEKQPWEC